MKISRMFSALFLIAVAITAIAYAQDNSKKDKSKDKKTAVKLIEVKANLMVLGADGKFADDVKSEDVKIYEDGVEQKITRFVKKDSPLNAGLVVDNSGSLRPSLAEIIKAASVIADNLEPTGEAFVMRFVSRDKIEILQDWTSKKDRLNSALGEMYVDGGQSAVIDALYLAAGKVLERETQNKSKRYALILISDGEDIDSYYKFEEMTALLKDTDIQIFILSYANLAPKFPKESVKFSNLAAFETGGIARILNKKRTGEEIIDALKAIVTELKSQYILNYVSTNQKRDGNLRKLTVQIADGAAGEKRQSVIREGFIVPEEK